MDKQQIINYVTTTPWNTNPAILSEMLDGAGGEGSGGGVLTVNFTKINDYSYSADVDRDTIINAFNNDLLIKGFREDDSWHLIYHVAHLDQNGNDATIAFVGGYSYADTVEGLYRHIACYLTEYEDNPGTYILKTIDESN